MIGRSRPEPDSPEPVAGPPDPALREFEYTVVELKGEYVKDRERDHAELINRVAAHGWRLISVQGDPGQFGSRMYAYFERAVVR
jgi:hypothetical protein